MLVADVMSSSVTMIDADATIREAAQLMAERDVGFLPATLEEACVGIVTDRDIVTRVVAAGLDPDKTHVAMVMSRGIPDTSPDLLASNEAIASVSAEATCEEATQKMNALGVQRLAVHDRDFRMIGVVSRHDVSHTSSLDGADRA